MVDNNYCFLRNYYYYEFRKACNYGPAENDLITLSITPPEKKNYIYNSTSINCYLGEISYFIDRLHRN